MRKLLFAALLFLLPLAAHAQTPNCSPLPYTLMNGTVADAAQVQANFNHLHDCINANPALTGYTQGKIAVGLAGGNVGYRYETTGVSILDFGTNVCAGGDDTTPLLAAVSTGQNVFLPMGTCNFNSTQAGTPLPFVAQLTAPGQCIIGAGNWGTVISSTITNAFIFKLTNSGQCVRNLQFSLANMADGFAVYATTGSSQTNITHVSFQNGPGLLAVQGGRSMTVQDLWCAGANGGTVSRLNAASGTSRAVIFDQNATNFPGLTLTKVVCQVANAIFLELDGHADTTNLWDVQLNSPNICIFTQDSGNVGGPNFLYGENVQCQTPTSNVAGFDFTSGVDIQLVNVFCNAASGSCAYIGSGVQRVYFSQVDFAGCGFECIYIDGTTVKFVSGSVQNAGQNGANSCTRYGNNYCPAIGVGAQANDVLVSGLSTKTGTGNQAYFLDVVSGAVQVKAVGNNMLGNLVGEWVNEGGNTCGSSTNTGVLYVVDDGQCALQYTNRAPNGITYSASNMVNQYVGGMITVDRSTAAAAITDTTDTAANLLAVIPSSYVGFQWLLKVVNNSQTPGATISLANGSGVVVTNPSTVANSSNYRIFRCTVSNVSTPAVTCAGQ